MDLTAQTGTQSVSDAGKNEIPRSALLVGNDSLLLVVLKFLLEKAGCTVRTASNGTMALGLMAGEISFIAIIDGDLPDFSSSNLAHHLKMMAEVERPSQHCCTIWISDALKSADRSGFDHVLDKPLQEEHIIRVLKHCEEELSQTGQWSVNVPRHGLKTLIPTPMTDPRSRLTAAQSLSRLGLLR